MGEPTRDRSAVHLDELAAVTREYATYSRTAHGAAFVGTGAFLAGTTAGHVLSGGGALVAAVYLLAPAVWVVLLALCRRYYQRHGGVIEPEPAPMSRSARRLALGAVYFTAASGLWMFAAGVANRPEWRQGAAAAILLLLVVFGLMAVPVLAATHARGAAELSWTFILATAAMWAADVDIFHAGSPVGRGPGISVAYRIVQWMVIPSMVAGAVWMIVVGVRQHLRYRRLERRLTALKERA